MKKKIVWSENVCFCGYLDGPCLILCYMKKREDYWHVMKRISFWREDQEYTNIAGKQIISKFHEEKVPKSSYKELRSKKYDKGGKSSSLLQA